MSPLNTVLLLVYMFSMITQTGGDEQDNSERHSDRDNQSEDDLFPTPRTTAHPPESNEPTRNPISFSSADMVKAGNDKKKVSENKKTTISNIGSNTENPTVERETSTAKGPDPKKKNGAVKRVRSTSILTSVLSLAGVWWLLTSFLCSLLYCLHWICSKHG